MPIQEPTRQTIREDDAGGVEGAGPLATLKTNKYQFSSFNYPIDIENLSHAMLFNIRVHEKSKDLGSREEIAESNLQTGRRGRLLQGSPNVQRKYVTVKRAISLYMPDTIVFDNKQNYEAPSLLEKLGIAGTAVIATGTGSRLNDAAKSINDIAAAAATIVGGTANTAARAARAIGSIAPGAITAAVSSLFKADRQKITPVVRIAAQLSGFAVNPVIEVLYYNPMLERLILISYLHQEMKKKLIWFGK